MPEIREYAIKLIIIGDPAVGKTSLIKKFVSDQFSNDYRASIGTNLFLTKIELDPLTKVKIAIWDIAGHEKWINSRQIYYMGTRGAIIVGDVTRPETFNQIEKFWYPDVKKSCKNAPIILLANKNDLKNATSGNEISDIGDRINAASVVFTSAKTGDNVEDAFRLIAERTVNQSFNE